MSRQASRQDDLAPGDEAIIWREVDSFIQAHFLRWSDREDLFQEAVDRWLGQRMRYEAERGAAHATFLKRVARSAFKDVLRDELTVGRAGARGALSFERPDAGGDSLVDRVQSNASFEEADVVIGLKRAIAQLSERQRRVVRGLLVGYGLRELARPARRRAP